MWQHWLTPLDNSYSIPNTKTKCPFTYDVLAVTHFDLNFFSTYLYPVRVRHDKALDTDYGHDQTHKEHNYKE